ncbi:MAG: hypothetical protein INH41_02955 [Myxococcaceae bacterium]|jgi:hypothetical protein|nr:hypothetical protein [Myxococcaceae bacterium]MCA3011339.1 hypothetical protein [Myxococcaceae bacterium]
MRLPAVAAGPSGPLGVVLKVAKAFGREPYDVVKLLMYRRDFLAGGLNPLCQDIMRGASGWTVGERELMAAFISKSRRCPF